MRFSIIALYVLCVLFNCVKERCGNQLPMLRITKLNKCWPKGNHFLTLNVISLQQCVKECDRRRECKGINYRRRVRVCELILTTIQGTTLSLTEAGGVEAEMELNNISDGPCISVIINNTQNPSNCSCAEHEVCIPSTGQCSIQECAPLVINNGTYVGNINAFGARRKLKCYENYYEIGGKTETTCLRTGKWSYAPVCKHEKTVGFPCRTPLDCFETNGICVGGICLCSFLDKWNETVQDCVTVCTNVSESFQIFDNIEIEDATFYHTTPGVSVGVCKAICIVDPKCLAFVRFGDGRCDMKEVSYKMATDAGLRVTSDGSDKATYSRTCV